MPDVAGLFDSFLEAAVSLAVLFVIVAWVSSKIVELGQLTFNVHGKMLRDELERCFGEESGPHKGRFTRYFYWHPMIVPLTQPSALVSFWRSISGGFASRGETESADPESRFPPGRLPGHIAPESFAAVVMNPFPWPTTEEALRRLLIANLRSPGSAESIPADAVPRLIREGQISPAGETWAALIERAGLAEDLSLNPIFLDSPVDMHSGPGRNDPAEHYVAMCRANELVPHPLETRIITLLRDAGNDLDDFRTGLRRWYAEAMARVTGRFKRTALIWVFLVSLIICILFNLNAINLFSALMKSPELRAAGVAASQAVGTKPGGIEALAQKVEFTDAYGRCVDKSEQPQPPKPDLNALEAGCKTEFLKALWRDSRKLNQVETFVSESPPSPVEQVTKVAQLCQEGALICSAPFEAKLRACRVPANPAGQPNPAIPAQTPQPSRPSTYEEVADQCREAWDAIWSTSGFFWHPGAARQLALSLAGKSSDEEAKKLLPLLYAVRMQAAAETGAVEKFIRKLPDLGPVWKDKSFWKADGAEAKLDVAAIFRAIFGVLLSALLAALGAPFWYDVLGKLSRRGTSGARGEKT